MRKRNELSPIWPDSFSIPVRPSLQADLAADVCVVGAGIAGLTIAYRLAREGVKTIVLDAGTIGGGETERTTAHLALALDEGYAELLRVHGTEAIRLAAASHAAAIDEIERIASEERIDCGFERLDGYLFSAPDDPSGAIEPEYAASLEAKIAGISTVARAPLASFTTGAAIRYPRQAQFHPLRYLAGVAAAFERLGGRVFCGTRAESVRGGRRARVTTESGKVISTGAVVIATNTPFNDRIVLHTKLASYRTYVVAAPLSSKGTERALYWDTEDPYHYARIQPGREGGADVLIVGGEDHKTGQAEGSPDVRFERLEAWSRARFDGVGVVTHRWSGQVVSTNDGLAFIGRNPGDDPNVYVVTGDCGHGMTHGTIAGLMLPALIAGRSHPWEALYDPSRFVAGAVARWARENLNAAAQYVRHLAGGDADSVEALAPGTGAVIRRGLSQIAVYRAEDGSLIERSAVCPHLGAVVRWNPAEKTWDCPAHGSRFDCEGRVVNGPAVVGLREAKPAARARRPKRAAGKARAPKPRTRTKARPPRI